VTEKTSPFRQPRAVWAVAFACVVSFMGIGLVDPILASLRDKLHASPAQVELLGGALGQISWRGPFFGVSVLMAIALIATLVLLAPTPRPARRQRLREPLVALRHRSLATTSVVGLLYNWAFFTLLGYSPFLMNIASPEKLGLVFCAWGVLVAIFAVWARRG
jgi:hypothetical protein